MTDNAKKQNKLILDIYKIIVFFYLAMDLDSLLFPCHFPILVLFNIHIHTCTFNSDKYLHIHISNTRYNQNSALKRVLIKSKSKFIFSMNKLLCFSHSLDYSINSLIIHVFNFQETT